MRPSAFEMEHIAAACYSCCRPDPGPIGRDPTEECERPPVGEHRTRSDQPDASGAPGHNPCPYVTHGPRLVITDPSSTAFATATPTACVPQWRSTFATSAHCWASTSITRPAHADRSAPQKIPSRGLPLRGTPQSRRAVPRRTCAASARNAPRQQTGVRIGVRAGRRCHAGSTVGEQCRAAHPTRQVHCWPPGDGAARGIVGSPACRRVPGDDGDRPGCTSSRPRCRR